MLSINSRRIGRFNVSRPLIEDPTFDKMILSIFGNIKILRAQFNYQRDLFEYEGIYSGFDELPAGSFIPEYELIFDSKTLKLAVKKIQYADTTILEGAVAELREQAQTQMRTIAELREQMAALTLKLNTSLNEHPKLPQTLEVSVPVQSVEVKSIRKPRVKKPSDLAA